MKKIFNVLLLVFVSILFYSCQTSPENKGKIVVTNQAENETDVIIAVYAKPEGLDSYSLYWSSADGAGYMQDAYFYIESGNYDVRVYVRKQTAFFPYYTLDNIWERGEKHACNNRIGNNRITCSKHYS